MNSITTGIEPHAFRYRYVNPDHLCICDHHRGDPYGRPVAAWTSSTTDLPMLCLECWAATIVDSPNLCSTSIEDWTDSLPSDDLALFRVQAILPAIEARVEKEHTPWRTAYDFREFMHLFQQEFLPDFWDFVDQADPDEEWAAVSVILEGLLGFTGVYADMDEGKTWAELVVRFPAMATDEFRQHILSLFQEVFPKRIRRQARLRITTH
ncbi:uncharacterized protein JN550_003088 [Neoarthrinium moseri]|uniref:uncharacterized protein n=1 Tax=Neoarthrinium moseri TaxID=1658444 RepID=UPI001FDBEF21|nr:uncharacterized protein JN550_003088 [Neoarthrinium moseri]KAI1873819.1 hypothetical protein JN550_003088 [Neoarthrinium moseri]